MNISARLVISGVIVTDKEFVLPAETVVIGRGNANDLLLKDPEISRRHARITYQDGRYYVEDLDSTNGTYLNDRRLQAQTPLTNGDVIRLGESIRLTYYGPAGGDIDETYIISEDPQEYIETPPLRQPAAYQAPQYQPPPQYEPPQPPQQQPPFGEPSFARPIPPAEPYQLGQAQAEPRKERSTNRILLGCGCLLLLAIVACGAALFLLDSYAPDLLYCGFLQPVLEGLGFAPLACP